MADTRADIPSVESRARRFTAGAPVVAAHFLGGTAAFVLGEEMVLLVAEDGSEQRTPIHGGAILAAAADDTRLITGGDDGSVMMTDARGESSLLARDLQRRWIDHVAVGPNRSVAWSAGKQAFARAARQDEAVLEAPSTVGGLSFAPKGYRLAIAHYNGATLWYPGARAAAPDMLAWKGSHLGARFSRDGKFLVTAMQDHALHGWRLADRRDMRMSGYTAQVRSLDFTAGGKWLATSGSTQLILWPFQGSDGPMGKTPRLLAPRDVQVEIVAGHPQQEVVAVGFADGMVLIVRIEDGAEVLARAPGTAPITALRWNADGRMLAFAAEDGDAAIVGL